MELGDFWERQAESWVQWARKPGHDSYWRFHRDRFFLDAAVREAARVLAPDGRYAIAIMHPLNTAGAFTSRDDDAPFVIQGSYFERATKELPVERDGLQMTFLDAHRPLGFSTRIDRSRTTSGRSGLPRSWSSGCARSRMPPPRKAPRAGAGSRSSCTSVRSTAGSPAGVR